MYGSWFLDVYITIQWLWLGLEGYFWKNSINGDTQIDMPRVSFAYKNRSITMGDEMYASTCDKPNLWDGYQELDNYAKEISSMAKFRYKIRWDNDSSKAFPSFQY